MSSQGPNSPSTIVSDTGNPVGSALVWNTPSNAGASDDTYTTVTNLALDDVSEYLKSTNFGFSIPGGSTIDGIVVEVERKCDQASACWDYSIKIVKGGTEGGTDQSATAYWSTTEGYVTFGSSSNLWGLSWTVSDINSSGFGVSIACQDGGVGTGWVSRVDHVRITVYYTPPVGGSKFALLGVG